MPSPLERWPDGRPGGVDAVYSSAWRGQCRAWSRSISRRSGAAMRIRALTSPFTASRIAVHATAASYFRDLFDFRLDGLSRTAQCALPASSSSSRVAFVAYLIDFARALAGRAASPTAKRSTRSCCWPAWRSCCGHGRPWQRRCPAHPPARHPVSAADRRHDRVCGSANLRGTSVGGRERIAAPAATRTPNFAGASPAHCSRGVGASFSLASIFIASRMNWSDRADLTFATHLAAGREANVKSKLHDKIYSLVVLLFRRAC